MRENGWCLSEITMVSEEISLSCLNYLRSLHRYQIRKDHALCMKQVFRANEIESSK